VRMTAHLRSEVLFLIPPINGPEAFHPSGAVVREEIYDFSISGS
jgi:hypothetical protein